MSRINRVNKCSLPFQVKLARHRTKDFRLFCSQNPKHTTNSDNMTHNSIILKLILNFRKYFQHTHTHTMCVHACIFGVKSIFAFMFYAKAIYGGLVTIKRLKIIGLNRCIFDA